MRSTINAHFLRCIYSSIGLKSSRRLLVAIWLLALVGFAPLCQAQFIIGGAASSLGSGCYQLTPGSTDQKGYVYSTSAIDLNDTIYMKFRVNLGSNNGNGADGIMFVLRDTLDTPFIGSFGSPLGFDASSMSTNSLGVEFDTRQDNALNDPGEDHVGIQKNGSTNHVGANALAGPMQALAGSVNIEDGQDHTFEVSWNPSTQVFRVRVDCSTRLEYTGDLINGVFSGDSIVFWGFLGTTSGAVNDQRFCLTVPIEGLVTELEDTTLCVGDTIQLDAGDPSVSYLWTPPLGVSSTTDNDPLIFPTASTGFQVRKTYECDTIFDSVHVEVLQPDFSISGMITDASCKSVCDGEVDVTVSGGAGTVYGYDWSNSETTEDIDDLCDGTYFVTVQDVDANSPNYLCHAVDTFIVTEPDTMLANIINQTKTQCPKSSACNAEATGVGSGGTLPYSFSWSNGESNSLATQLCPGWNFMTITDDLGCMAFDSVNILVPDTIVTTAFGDTLICIDNLAAIVATSSGGTPPFSYIWRKYNLNGPITSTVPADAVSPPVSTLYYVQSFDGNGCLGDTGVVNVQVRPPLDIAFTPIDTICPYDTITLEAIGLGGDSIYTYSWDGGPFGPNKTVSPDEPTYYSVTLSDFCGTPFTVDSILVQVGGYKDIRTTIRFDDDSLCNGESTYLIASGRDGFNGPDEYTYTWGHTTSGNNIQFVTPTQTTTYTVTIEDLCLSKPAADTLTVYVGRPEMPDLVVDPVSACKESDVTFSLDEFNPKYTYNWGIDSLDFFESYDYDSLLYRFSAAGCYFIDLDVTTDFGCFASKRFDCAVKILQDPVADFDYTPEHPSSVAPFVTFTNTSERAEHVYWIMDFDSIYDQNVVSREFLESPDPYNVHLIAISAEGCIDSSTVQLQYFEETVVYYPNSFSPNGDGMNDLFFIESEGTQLADFDLIVYNRWGEQMFRTTRQSQGWDGRTPSGKLVPMGTYFFVLNYRDRFNIERTVSAPIHIAKTGEPLLELR